MVVTGSPQKETLSNRLPPPKRVSLWEEFKMHFIVTFPVLSGTTYNVLREGDL